MKFQLIDIDEAAIAAGNERRLARGAIQNIGGEATITLEAAGHGAVTRTAPMHDQSDATQYILEWLGGGRMGGGAASVAAIEAVGHRVVHGGERFTLPVRIDDEVWRELEGLSELAPLHNPYNLRGIASARALLGRNVPQVAVFDTAFHSSLPEVAYLYAIPHRFYRDHRVRRYGFHGTSHRFLASRYRQLTGVSSEATKIITLHLGNGASACAIRNGRSVDTSMGFTPLEGLVMGTRSGDLDPAILEFVAEKEGLTLHEMMLILNERSGLLGISGTSGDMRVILESEVERGDRSARLAVDVFCYRVRKYLGAYLAAMNGADAVVFSGGIGEHSPAVRARICAGLDWLGIALDPQRNDALHGAEGRIDARDSRVQLWVIPTNEELMIARDTCSVLSGASDPV